MREENIGLSYSSLEIVLMLSIMIDKIGKFNFHAINTDTIFSLSTLPLQKVRDEHPDVLVLLGPFVDTKHPLIEKGDTGDMTLEQLFQSQISHISKNVPDYTRVSNHGNCFCNHSTT